MKDYPTGITPAARIALDRVYRAGSRYKQRQSRDPQENTLKLLALDYRVKIRFFLDSMSPSGYPRYRYAEGLVDDTGWIEYTGRYFQDPEYIGTGNEDWLDDPDQRQRAAE